MTLTRVPRWLLPLIIGLALVASAQPALAATPTGTDRLPVHRNQGGVGGQPVVFVRPIADYVYLDGVRHDWQQWNNCGPTTTSMALSYFGINAPQLTIASVLKPNPKDVNVSPDQIVNYARSRGLYAQMRVNGNRETLMKLLSNDIPVIAEQWIPDDGGMGHYRLVTGYNRPAGTVTFDDSYYGPDRVWTWEQFEGRWMEFSINRVYIPIYRPDQEDVVTAILGEDANDYMMWVRAEAGARANLEGFPYDARVWFGLGDALINQGRAWEAVQAYERSVELGLPWRWHWYQFGHFEALAQVGNWQRLLELTGPVLKAAPMHEDMYYYRGLALQNMGDYNGAREAFNQSLANNRNFGRARAALNSLN